MTSVPRVADNPAGSRFEITVDGALAGFAQYRRTDTSITFTHTEIDPAYEGQGLGSALARHALDAAGADSLDVVPLCPFIRAYIERHPTYVDLVPAGRRAEFGLG